MTDAVQSRPPWPTRRRITMAVALLVAAAAYVVQPRAGGWEGLYADVFKAGMRGPYGTVPPPPIASEPPSRSVRLVGTAQEPPVIFGGLRLERHLSDVRAIDIRTGETYWWYHRRGKFLDDFQVDRADGDVYLTWRGIESDRVEDLDRINVRTGKVRWRQDMRRLIVQAGGEEDDELVLGGVRADTNTVVLLTSHLAIGLSHGDGRERWTIRQPDNCALYLDRAPVTAQDGILVLPRTCIEQKKSKGHLVGVDAATGTERWNVNVSRWLSGYRSVEWVGKALRPHGNGRLVFFTGPWDPRAPVINVRTGEIVANVPNALPPSHDVGNGIWVGTCDVRKTGRADGWCAVGFGTGKRLWSLMNPRGLEAEPEAFVVDQRVYVLLERYDQDLVVRDLYLGILDLQTGEWVGRYALPHLKGSDRRSRGEAKITAIRDGIVVVEYDDGPSGLFAETSR
jgi:outer membrane protein assembly factor BamB